MTPPYYQHVHPSYKLNPVLSAYLHLSLWGWHSWIQPGSGPGWGLVRPGPSAAPEPQPGHYESWGEKSSIKLTFDKKPCRRFIVQRQMNPWRGARTLSDSSPAERTVTRDVIADGDAAATLIHRCCFSIVGGVVELERCQCFSITDTVR